MSPSEVKKLGKITHLLKLQKAEFYIDGDMNIDFSQIKTW